MRSQPVNEQPIDDSAARAPVQVRSAFRRPHLTAWRGTALRFLGLRDLFGPPPALAFRDSSLVDHQWPSLRERRLSDPLRSNHHPQRRPRPLWGNTGVYDPDMLAGSPVGLIFDVDNKARFPFTYGLTKLGVPRPTAFNLFVVLSFVVLPFSLLFAARLFRPAASRTTLRLGARSLGLAFRLHNSLFLVRRNDLLGYCGPSGSSDLGATTA